MSLVQHGGTLISDDVAVLREIGGRITVATGTQRLKIRSDSARSLLGSCESLEPTWSSDRPAPPKHFVAVAPSDADTAEGNRNLDLLYVLAPWSEAVAEPSLHSLTPAQALVKLMAHRHVAVALNAASHQRDFEILARLAETAPASDLARPAGLETTGRTVAAIMSDVRRRASAS
jgi:hypothetical protein